MRLGRERRWCRSKIRYVEDWGGSPTPLSNVTYIIQPPKKLHLIDPCDSKKANLLVVDELEALVSLVTCTGVVVVELVDELWTTEDCTVELVVGTIELVVVVEATGAEEDVVVEVGAAEVLVDESAPPAGAGEEESDTGREGSETR